MLATDPVASVYLGYRLAHGLLSEASPGQLLGYPGDDPTSLLHVGANLVPFNTDEQARNAFVEALGAWRRCVAVLGASDEVVPLWRSLAGRWGASWGDARLIRWAQPVMQTSSAPQVDADPRVTPANPAHFDSYLGASVAMYLQELDEDPLQLNPRGYQLHVADLIESGRAFSVVEDDAVIFKADIGASAHGVAQIQGVWVHPRFRGRGLAVPAMAAVTNLVLADHDVACLYVNDFNAPAIATYLRCGYEVSGQNSTVLY